jgi:hypothetical protein
MPPMPPRLCSNRRHPLTTSSQATGDWYRAPTMAGWTIPAMCLEKECLSTARVARVATRARSDATAASSAAAACSPPPCCCCCCRQRCNRRFTRLWKESGLGTAAAAAAALLLVRQCLPPLLRPARPGRLSHVETAPVPARSAEPGLAAGSRGRSGVQPSAARARTAPSGCRLRLAAAGPEDGSSPGQPALATSAVLACACHAAKPLRCRLGCGWPVMNACLSNSTPGGSCSSSPNGSDLQRWGQPAGVDGRPVVDNGARGSGPAP